jgi:hypothetical protein
MAGGLAAASLAAMALGAGAQPVRTEHVTAELVARSTGVQPGQPLQVGLRLQHIPLEHLFREVSPHPRLQTLHAAQLIISTFAFHTLHPPPPPPPPPQAIAAAAAAAHAADVAVPPGAAPPPPPAAAAEPAASAPSPASPLRSAGGWLAPAGWSCPGSSLAPQPPRRYSLVDPRVVRLHCALRVRDGEERVRQLCESLPADAPIKFVTRMRVTIGQTGVLMAKSRRGSLKLRFDHLGLPVDRRDFWYPPEALCYPGGDAVAAVASAAAAAPPPPPPAAAGPPNA